MRGVVRAIDRVVDSSQLRDGPFIDEQGTAGTSEREVALVAAATGVERGLKEFSKAASEKAIAIDDTSDVVFSPTNHSIVGPPSPPVSFDVAEKIGCCDQRGALRAAANDNTTLADLVGVCVDLSVIGKH